MTFTLTAGWWLLPLAATIAAFWRASHLDREDTAGRGDYGFAAFVSAIYYGCALILSLAAWLAWALLA